jgi:hypothetical protein
MILLKRQLQLNYSSLFNKRDYAFTDGFKAELLEKENKKKLCAIITKYILDTIDEDERLKFFESMFKEASRTWFPSFFN